MTSVSPLPKPIPEINDLTRPFWEAAARRELRMQRCLDCGHIRFPPSPVCTTCLSPRSEWAALSGQGRVLSHLVFHRSYHPAWQDDVPYSVIMVELDEGPRMFSDLRDPATVDADLVGRRVAVWFDDSGKVVTPRFALAD